MRFMITARWPVAAGNAAARAGTMGETIQAILEDIKPEAVYFAAVDGQRTTIMIIDLASASDLPRVAEPKISKRRDRPSRMRSRSSAD